MRGDGLFSVLASGERDVVIFLDEVPILVNRILKGDDGQITPPRNMRLTVSSPGFATIHCIIAVKFAW